MTPAQASAPSSLHEAHAAHPGSPAVPAEAEADPASEVPALGARTLVFRMSEPLAGHSAHLLVPRSTRSLTIGQVSCLFPLDTAYYAAWLTCSRANQKSHFRRGHHSLVLGSGLYDAGAFHNDDLVK